MEKELTNIHEKATRDFDRIQTALYQERRQALQDRRFYSIAGAQWEGDIGAQFENKPKFEVNKIHLSVIKIINEYRNNRITVAFITKDGDPSSELADICAGLFRADEEGSGAQEAYDNAFEEAVGGGIGAMRLTTEYEDEGDPENEKQRIRIEPVYDADSSVYFDLDSKRQDKADAKYCFVIHSMTPEDYADEYGEGYRGYGEEEEEDDLHKYLGAGRGASVNKNIHENEYDWYAPDLIHVAEYYKVESATHTIRIYKTLTSEEEQYADEDFEDDPELEASLSSSGKRFDRSRKIKTKKIHKYIMDGNRILEDCGFIAGTEIPIVPTYGKRWFIEGIERCMGHVRLAKDMQRVKNMLMSKLAEIASLSAIGKPIFAPEQVAGHEPLWAEDNIKNYPYLLINPLEDAQGQVIAQGPIAYTKPPDIPPALAALMQLADLDIKELLGNYQEADQMLSHVSGKAHEMIQKRIDGQAFIYMDNFSKAIQRVGEVWLEMAKDVYVEPGRKMKTVGTLNELSQITLQQPGINSSGSAGTVNNLSEATFDVTVDTGPSSDSQRQSTVQTLMGMLGTTQDPQTRQVLESMILMSLDGEGITETREFFRKQLVKLGVLQPTPEEAEAMSQEQEPSAQDQALLGMAAEAHAKAQKAMADVQKVLSDIELNAAKTAQTYSDVDMANLQMVKDSIEAEQNAIATEQQKIQRMLSKQEVVDPSQTTGSGIV